MASYWIHVEIDAGARAPNRVNEGIRLAHRESEKLEDLLSVIFEQHGAPCMQAALEIWRQFQQCPADSGALRHFLGQALELCLEWPKGTLRVERRDGACRAI